MSNESIIVLSRTTLMCRPSTLVHYDTEATRTEGQFTRPKFQVT